MARRIRISARKASEGIPDVAMMAPMGMAGDIIKSTGRGIFKSSLPYLLDIADDTEGGRVGLTFDLSSGARASKEMVESLASKFGGVSEATRNQLFPYLQRHWITFFDETGAVSSERARQFLSLIGR